MIYFEPKKNKNKDKDNLKNIRLDCPPAKENISMNNVAMTVMGLIAVAGMLASSWAVIYLIEILLK